jgi:hypothetical protein
MKLRNACTSPHIMTDTLIKTGGNDLQVAGNGLLALAKTVLSLSDYCLDDRKVQLSCLKMERVGRIAAILQISCIDLRFFYPSTQIKPGNRHPQVFGKISHRSFDPWTVPQLMAMIITVELGSSRSLAHCTYHTTRCCMYAQLDRDG